jgi:superfamily II DNA or RNA helicase
MIVHKLNESFSSIEGDPAVLKNMFEFLKVERPGAYFEPAVKAGFKSTYEYFASIQNKQLLVMNGHLDLLKNFNINIEPDDSDYSENEIDEFVDSIELPFEPYDFQIKAFKESILNVKQINRMCTGAGKSLTISLMAEFFRKKGKKGLLLVPNINLLTQFKNDIKDYGLIDLYDDTHTIGGGQTERHFDCTLTISTWQSMMNYKDDLHLLDYVITDESHRFASDVTAGIIKETVNCKYKWGFTGTIPEDPVQKMELFGLFGLPKTYVRSFELIERGLATPIKINSIIFKYDKNDKNLFKESGNYVKQLKFIKEHEKRNELIVKLMAKIKTTGNTLCLFQHTDHGKALFIDIMKKLYPEVEVENKNITGKKSFEFQEQYGIYFLNGEDDAKTREKTRKILEEEHYNVTLEDGSHLSFHEDDKVVLIDGSKKIVKNLTEDDEIDGNLYLHQ